MGCASAFCMGGWGEGPHGVREGKRSPFREEPPMPPRPFDLAVRWREVSEEIMAGIEAWRLHHPKATLREMEAAVDERLAELRARMLQDVALASQAADL